MYLALLLGNTTVRYATFDKAGDLRFRTLGRMAWKSLEVEAKLLVDIDSGAFQAVLVGSVRDDLFAELCSYLPPGLPTPLFAGRDFEIVIENEYERSEEVGTDRLLNSLAAHRRAGTRGAIVVDFGTAISISVVSPQGSFLGGAIAAGMPALLSGLSLVTPRLPALAPVVPEKWLGRSTVDALQAGLFSQIVGGVSRLLVDLQAELKFSDPLVLATGGDANAFAPSISAIAETVPNLTMEGLLLAYDRYRSS